LNERNFIQKIDRRNKQIEIKKVCNTITPFYKDINQIHEIRKRELDLHIFHERSLFNNKPFDSNLEVVNDYFGLLENAQNAQNKNSFNTSNSALLKKYIRNPINLAKLYKKQFESLLENVDMYLLRKFFIQGNK